MERREQVFISSTYVDLREERRAVIQGLLEADCIPSGMELFPASDADKWDLIKGVIDDCDYYLLIVGGRYGSVDPETELSYTEMEFDYAVSVNKPVMAFLHGSPGSISVEKSELDPSLRGKLDVFREKVEQRMVKYWSTPGDLDGAVAKSLIKLRKTHPAEGWIRARHAMTPEVERDIAELRAKVSDLTQQLAAARTNAKPEIPEGLADGDDVYNLLVTMRYFKTDDQDQPDYHRKTYRKYLDIPVTWNGIVSHLAPVLLDESEEKALRAEIVQFAKINVAEDKDRFLPKNFDKERSFLIEDDTNRDIIVQLFALGLIEHGTKKRPISDTGKYWRLTDRGRDRLMLLRAIRSERTSE